MPEPNPLQQIGPQLFPPGTLLGDAERRARAAKAAEHVAEVTAILAVATRVIPGPAGKIIGGLIAGVEKDPGTGKVRPGTGTAGNFLPSPFGFLDPKAVGLEPNFYLPSGATDYVPIVADQIGLGLSEQRAIDDRAARKQIDRKRAALARRVEGVSDETLRDLVATRGGFTRAGEIMGFAGLGFDDISQIASAEQVRRERTAADPTPAQIAAQLNPVTQPTPQPSDEIIRFVYEIVGELPVNGVVSAATAIDRLFAANPPDP